ncbi:hypothetical protein D3C77_647390 [compost metagenome]
MLRQPFQIDQPVPAHHRARAALLMQYLAAQGQVALRRIDQMKARRDHPLHRKLQQITGTTPYRHALLDLRHLHGAGQLHRINLVLAAVIATAPGHQ